MKPNDYVEQRGEGWYVRGSRVSLDSLIFAFRDGLSPEAIARECFPTLLLGQVYGAIAFYLAHRPELDAVVENSVAQGDAWRREQQTRDAAFSRENGPGPPATPFHVFMKLRLQADADLNQRIVTGLRRLEPAVDFQTAGSATLEGKLDPEVLAFCADSGRLLVTHDQRTMPHHFGEFIRTRQSPGIIIVPQNMPIAQAIAELYLAWSAGEAEEWANGIRRLPL